jgi:hypothetical protein
MKECSLSLVGSDYNNGRQIQTDPLPEFPALSQFEIVEP